MFFVFIVFAHFLKTTIIYSALTYNITHNSAASCKRYLGRPPFSFPSAEVIDIEFFIIFIQSLTFLATQLMEAVPLPAGSALLGTSLP